MKTAAAPTLLLIHGLGATGGVWADVIEQLEWPGRVIAPDLPGHGLASPASDYTVGALAAAVAQHTENGEPVVAVGHSLGGAVALCLASGFFRPVVSAAVGVGIKVRWSDEDVAGMAKVAAKGVRWFETRDEAVDRFLRQSGLSGVARPDHPAVAMGVTEVDGQWRVAQDPATFAQRALKMRGLVDAATCPIVLGAGEHDAMVSGSDLAPFVDAPEIAAGRGHNVQVEDPAWIVARIEQVAPRPV